MEKWQVRMSGSGGQGIIRGAVILAQAAIFDGGNAVQSQVYGPESRGGSTKGEVVISDGEIYYPKVVIPNLVICMSPEAYKKYGQEIAPGGILIVDNEFCNAENVPEGVACYEIPMTQMARESLGTELSANVVALGVMQELTGIVSMESLKDALAESFKAKVYEANLKALQIGVDAAKAAKAAN